MDVLGARVEQKPATLLLVGTNSRWNRLLRQIGRSWLVPTSHAFVHEPSSLPFDHKMTLLPPSREMNLGRRKRGEPKLSQSFSSCRILAGCPTETDCMESMRVPLCPEIPKFRKSSKHGGAAHSALAESRVRLILYHPYADFELRRSGRSATAYTSCFSTTHKTRASERAGGRHID